MVLEELDLEQDWTQDDRQDQEITPSVTALQTYSANPEFSHVCNVTLEFFQFLIRFCSM